MSADEIRAAADRIAAVYNVQDGDAETWRAMVKVVASARRLAEVIDYANGVRIVRRATVLDLASVPDHTNGSER